VNRPDQNASPEVWRAYHESQRREYKIVRMYFKGGKRTIATRLTLEEAQAHCQSTETSSRTCTKSVNVLRTRRMGAWFDGYERE
jgi:hypothetical protein